MKIQLAYATDMNYIDPTVVSIMSALENTSQPVLLHLLGYELSEDAIDKVSLACNKFPGAKFKYHEITNEMLTEEVKDLKLPPSTFSRLFISDLVDLNDGDKVLYIDSDTIVYGDLSPIFEIDLKGSYMGAVRDIAVLSIKFTKHDEDMFINEYRNIMHPFPLADYFNAGVLLLDCRSIINNEALAKKMKDLKNASKYIALDQSHLNNLFKGHVTYLDPKYNCYWGDFKNFTKHQYYSRFENEGNLGDDPVIVHFVGSSKPWNSPDMSKFEIFKRKLLGGGTNQQSITHIYTKIWQSDIWVCYNKKKGVSYERQGCCLSFNHSPEVSPPWRGPELFA